MACCLLFFSGDPIENDPRAIRSNRFQISMMDGLTTHQPWCCLTYLCPCCSAYYTRYRVLDGDMTKYMCCQGYFNCFCLRGGSCGEQYCPDLCLALESFFCVGPSMSASRLTVMDQYDLRPDPWDNRLIRFSNCCKCKCPTFSQYYNPCALSAIADLRVPHSRNLFTRAAGTGAPSTGRVRVCVLHCYRLVRCFV